MNSKWILTLGAISVLTLATPAQAQADNNDETVSKHPARQHAATHWKRDKIENDFDRREDKWDPKKTSETRNAAQKKSSPKNTA